MFSFAAVMSLNRTSRCHRLINEFYLLGPSRLTTFLLSNDFPKKLFLVNSFVSGTIKAAGKKTSAHRSPSMLHFTFHEKALQFRPRVLAREEKEEKIFSTLITFASRNQSNHRADTKTLFVCAILVNI